MISKWNDDKYVNMIRTSNIKTGVQPTPETSCIQYALENGQYSIILIV